MLLSALLVLPLAAALLRGSGSSGVEIRPEGAGLGGLAGSVLEGHPRDPRHRDRFIKHLTGPLSFHPKCRRHFHRLYHNTRDCTTPAYYKRCALLLTRLASSPRCTHT